MSKFIIEQTEDLPGIEIDANSGFIEFVGKVLPEDSISFFEPVEKATKEYLENPQDTTTINLKLEYLNSSSQKKLLELVTLFEDLSKSGKEVIINWFYPEDDEDIIEEGKDFAKMLSLKVNIVPL